MAEIQDPQAYIIRRAEGPAAPFIFAAPHSGRYYPDDFSALACLDETALRRSEDAFVDQLFENVTQLGATQLVATYARAYLDLNRAEDELDPSLFSPRLNDDGLNLSLRVKAGLGLIPRIISEGVSIYNTPIPAREAEKRTRLVYTPYHTRLRALLDEHCAKHGKAYLIDCHSMPSEGGRRKKRGPDIVLGDGWGKSCSRELTGLAEQLLIQEGFSVRRNVPYSGGYSTTYYGQPAHNIEALQIEINRAIYMDEETITPLPEFHHITQKLKNVTESLIRLSRERDPQTLANAAE